MDEPLLKTSNLAIAESLHRLLGAYPESARKIRLVSKEIGGLAQVFVDVFNDDSSSQWLAVPAGLDTHLINWRTSCYSTGRGSWFSASLTVHRDGSFETDFDYDSDPRLSDPALTFVIIREDIARELEMFPRHEPLWPAWFTSLRREFKL